jgi:succinate dehydrogenase flavin-adding protein (antitoxin of CptAB toxin-antitoxin module)
MLGAFRLIPALQLIFKTEIEFSEDCFVELTPSQREVFEQKMGHSDEQIYQVVVLEPTVVLRQEEKITLELSVVTESERQLMLEAVEFVYRATEEMPDETTTFQQRLDFLRRRLPPVVIGDEGHPNKSEPAE